MKLFFSSDYQEGAHPKILARLMETNLNKSLGYGRDEYCEAARNKIRAACSCPKAQVEFLVGGTQTNATVIKALLRPYQGVIACDTGHINGHEAGAIEATGHKVLTVPHQKGKLSERALKAYLDAFYADANFEHTVQPGMVYISQPTEYGTLYSLKELKALNEICRANSLYLYVDGARLAYALASSENTMGLDDLATLTDAFYIGGTKCGALFGEALVIPNPSLLPHFFTTIKQQGALLAKGRILGLQFDTLFSDSLYFQVGRQAIEAADKLRAGLGKMGFKFFFETTTNQIFLTLKNEALPALASIVEYGFWERLNVSETVIRLATSWATTDKDVEQLLAKLKSF